MAVYQIFLVKLGNIGLTDQQQTEVKNKIEALYNRVIHDGPVQGYTSSNVNWSSTCQNVDPHQLLVYIMQNDIVSVVREYINSVADSAHQMHFEPHLTGLTSWVTGPHGKTVSEVYVRNCHTNLDVIAKTVFHESMHYKHHWNDQQLHHRGGLAAASLDGTEQLTQRNIDDMKSKLTYPRDPLLSGCQIYADNSLDGLSMLNPDEHFRRAVARYNGSVQGGSFPQAALTGIRNKWS